MVWGCKLRLVVPPEVVNKKWPRPHSLTSYMGVSENRGTLFGGSHNIRKIVFGGTHFQRRPFGNSPYNLQAKRPRRSASGQVMDAVQSPGPVTRMALKNPLTNIPECDPLKANKGKCKISQGPTWAYLGLPGVLEKGGARVFRIPGFAGSWE